MYRKVVKLAQLKAYGAETLLLKKAQETKCEVADMGEWHDGCAEFQSLTGHIVKEKWDNESQGKSRRKSGKGG